jgi:GAF domain-containing protein
LALDERQYADESGPCLSCARTGHTVAIPDMAAESRWPRFTESAQKYGVRGSMSVPLAQREVAGALNYYVNQPGAFDSGTVDIAETFAAHAAVANAHLYEATATLAEHMRRAMASRAVIERRRAS